MGKADKPFNNPFQSLKLKKEEPAAKPTTAAPPMVVPAKPKGPRPSEDEESALFLESVGAVAPVRVTSPKAHIQPPPPAPRGSDAEEEAFLQLCELVTGDAPFDLADSDEFIEGAIGGLDPQVMRKLHRGDYAFQAHLDLHGLTKPEAKEQLAVFVQAARLKGHRCVLVVHGRGLHSKDNEPVLKRELPVWLTQGRIGKQVLAFATARPHDGGAGAVYVLLRK